MCLWIRNVFDLILIRYIREQDFLFNRNISVTEVWYDQKEVVYGYVCSTKQMHQLSYAVPCTYLVFLYNPTGGKTCGCHGQKDSWAIVINQQLVSHQCNLFVYCYRTLKMFAASASARHTETSLATYITEMSPRRIGKRNTSCRLWSHLVFALLSSISKNDWSVPNPNWHCTWLT